MFKIIFVLFLFQNLAFSKTCFIPSELNPSNSGDSNYSKILDCNQDLINQYWNDFNMIEWQWNDGFGYEDACNNKLPLGRMFNSLHALQISQNKEHKESVLNWSYDYSKKNIFMLGMACGSGSLNAKNTLGKVTFFMPGIYGNKSVIRRAGILFHESRHTLKIHNGHGKCPSGKSCDTNWEYKGANQYHVLWLWWFGRHSKNTTEALRNDALRDARWRHDNRFNTNPGKNI